MGRKKKSDNPTVKKKEVLIEKIPAQQGKNAPDGGPYAILKKLVTEHHAYLEDAKIALYWNKGNPREDADGTASFGKTYLANEILRDGAEFDFVIVLSHTVFNQSDEPTREAMLDELLCYCMDRKDKTGEQKLDTKDRICWRMRKPDIVTFSEILARRGPWKKSIKRLPALLAEHKDRQRGLLRMAEGTDKEPPKKVSDPAFAPGEDTSRATRGATNGHKRKAAAPDK